jgi:hypothetical protein
LNDAAFVDHLLDISRFRVEPLSYFIDRKATAIRFSAERIDRKPEMLGSIPQGYDVIIADHAVVRGRALVISLHQLIGRTGLAGH